MRAGTSPVTISQVGQVLVPVHVSAVGRTGRRSRGEGWGEAVSMVLAGVVPQAWAGRWLGAPERKGS